VTGVRVKRCGPIKLTGEHRCESTGSKRMRGPREAPGGVGSSTRKQAWPSHVDLILDDVPLPFVGLEDVTHEGVCDGMRVDITVCGVNVQYSAL
jgi:hypothetical protein